MKQRFKTMLVLAGIVGIFSPNYFPIIAQEEIAILETLEQEETLELCYEILDIVDLSIDNINPTYEINVAIQEDKQNLHIIAEEISQNFQEEHEFDFLNINFCNVAFEEIEVILEENEEVVTQRNIIFSELIGIMGYSIISTEEGNAPTYEIGYTQVKELPIIEETPVGYTVYVTESGTKYHTSGCQHLKSDGGSYSLEQAIELGYEACKVCKP
ncbi:MAG: hypothetical protein ATN36_09095 [Epulopiscium sp. Nele67-Bin005]|nr:MAG: hypothetical protein ATN36_09095 [Epulopiscium sp. Nele67-Bin005]